MFNNMFNALPTAIGHTVIFLSFTACVTSGTHEAVLADLAKSQQELASNQEQLSTTSTERDNWTGKAQTCDTNLTGALDQNTQLVEKISSMGQNVEALLGEKDSMAEERERLKKEVQELQRMRAAAEARSNEYREVVAKLATMIDAGTLEVKVRNGTMIVAMSSDVLFPAGGVKLKPEAREAIVELATTISTLTERKFQVVGHSDATPIRSARFPSNWELSSQRAIEVVKVMVEAGVPPTMVSAAGAAEFDPVASNETTEDKALNRRIEVVFVPKIDELPGFDKVLAGT